MKPFLVSAVVALVLLLQRAHCWEVQLGNLTNGNDEEKGKLGLIFPGTKWCGSGSTATSYDDLGKYADTDRCCRDHDYCSEVIEAGQSSYGLTNSAIYTRLECMCDERFHDCLKSVMNPVSLQIGVTYFNVLNTQCFRKDNPIIRCRRYSPIIVTRCLEYELDQNGEKIYQWFDVPLY